MLAGTLTVLYIESLDDQPDESVLPCFLKNASKQEKEVSLQSGRKSCRQLCSEKKKQKQLLKLYRPK